MDEASAVRVADLLEQDAGFILASLRAEAAKEPRVRSAWERAAKALGAGLFGGLLLGAVPLPAPAGVAPTVYYVNRRRGQLPAFAHAA